jgi:hypothetical protein
VDEYELIESFKPAPATTVAEVLARVASVPDRADIAAAAAERAEADARADARETRMMLNRRLGNPLGEVSRMQAVVSEIRDRVQAMETELEKERGRLSRASETLAHWSEQADEVYRASVQRSAPDDLLGPAKAILAGHQEYVAASRAAIAAVQAGTPRQRRPFGGEVRRSEFTCAGCKAEGIDPDTSFLLHSDPDRHPGLDAEIDFYPEPGEPVQRRGYSYAGEISR